MMTEPNICVIVCDALRPKNLPEWGYPKSTAPFITKLCDESAVYRNAFAHFPYTTPSVTTLLTGEYWFNHGIWKMSLDRRSKLLCDTIADVLPSEYNTTFINEPLRDTFDKEGIIWKSFDNAPSDYSGYLESFKEMQLKKRMPVAPSAKKTTDAALEYVNEDPFFLYVHYWEPHVPRAPKTEKYIREFYDSSVPPISISKHLMAVQRQGGRIALHDTLKHVKVNDLNYLMAWYDADIKFMDMHIQRLVSQLPDNTLIILTADHGEAMGEHGIYFQHKIEELYNEVLHVPLIVRYPERKRDTIYDNTENRIIFDLIISYLEDRTTVPISQDFIYSASRDLDAGIIDSLMAGKYKMVIRNLGTEEYGYNLFTDPGEHHPIPTENHPGFVKHREQLNSFMSILRDGFPYKVGVK